MPIKKDCSVVVRLNVNGFESALQHMKGGIPAINKFVVGSKTVKIRRDNF